MSFVYTTYSQLEASSLLAKCFIACWECVAYTMKLIYWQVFYIIFPLEQSLHKIYQEVCVVSQYDQSFLSPCGFLWNVNLTIVSLSNAAFFLKVIMLWDDFFISCIFEAQHCNIVKAYVLNYFFSHTSSDMKQFNFLLLCTQTQTRNIEDKGKLDMKLSSIVDNFVNEISYMLDNEDVILLFNWINKSLLWLHKLK